MAATSSYLPSIDAVVWDSQGRFYFAAGSQVFRVNRIGVVDLTVGTGVSGFGGDGGPAPAARLQGNGGLGGLAVDASNNLYIADRFNYRVRKVDAISGVITTVAGNGGFQFKGDGGLATKASLADVSGITFDADGNLYIADYLRVRKVAVATGIISTVAGNGNSQFSGDGGVATNAGMAPSSVAVGGFGDLYIADLFNHRVRKVSAGTGLISTIAGTGGMGYTGDNGPAVNAELSYPTSVQLDASGSLYISSVYPVIRKISPNGIITTFAGNGINGSYSGEGGPALQATLVGSGTIAINTAGDVLYTDRFESLVLKIDAVSTLITTVAGTTAIGDNGPLSRAQFIQPDGLAVDTAGNIYIGDSGARRVRKLSVATGLVTTVAGNGTYDFSGDGGLATGAGIMTTLSLKVASDSSGNLYFTVDSGRLRKVSAQTGLITTLSLSGGDLIANTTGVYTGGKGIFRIDPVTGSLITVVPTSAQFAGVNAFDQDSAGNFYYTSLSDVIEIPSDGSLLTSVAGNGCNYNCPDSTLYTGAQLGDGAQAVNAILQYPTGVKVDRAANLFIADSRDLRVRMVSSTTGKISTIAGTNVPGCEGSQGPATSAQFLNPSRLAIDGSGNIYVLDTNCRQLFKLTPQSNLTGYIDTANCQTISGWAADRSRLGQSISVNIYDGVTLIATVLANQSRSDVGALLGDDGMHGFTYTVPAIFRDGKAHNLHLGYESTNVDLTGSPKTLTCSVPLIGYIDSASCAGISGWIADRSRLNVPLTVTLWDGATQIASVTANGARADVGAVLGDNGLHAFSLSIPARYANITSQTFQVRYETSSVQVPGSPVTLTCGGASYAGYIDSSSCSSINGWILDRARLNQPLVVSLWDGLAQVASATANGSRPDVGSAFGDNGLHGFSLALPGGYSNRSSHTLEVHYETSANKVGSPVTLTCGGDGSLVGWVDHVGCDTIGGWAADKQQLYGQSISVDILDGASLISTILASGSRPDVGAILRDGGSHGFSLKTPASLRDGAPHSVQIRFSGTTQSFVPNSPQSLQCSPSSPSYVGWVERVSCGVVSGWAADQNALNQSISVDIYDGVTKLATVPAAAGRVDVGVALGDNGLHLFGYSFPTVLPDGTRHTITVRPAGSSIVLPGAKIVTCP